MKTLLIAVLLAVGVAGSTAENYSFTDGDVSVDVAFTDLPATAGVEYPSVVIGVHSKNKAVESFTIAVSFRRDGALDSRTVTVPRTKYNDAHWTSVAMWLGTGITDLSVSVVEHSSPKRFSVTRKP